MLTYLQAIVFGLVQGVTELFPISSLGHSVILPKVLEWHIGQSKPFFLTFLVATHAATATVLLVIFWKDWKKIIAGLIRSLQKREIQESDTYAKLAWLLIVGTIPAGILGILFQDALQNLFASPRIVAGVLLCNGILLIAAEKLIQRHVQKTETGSDERIAKLTWKKTLLVGILQSIALIPGFSRTGAAMTGGLLTGLSHEDSARFAFLLATPIIGAAAVLKLPEIQVQNLGTTLVGGLVAAGAAYFSVRFLLKYFETKRLTVFGVYCVTIGVLTSVLFFFS